MKLGRNAEKVLADDYDIDRTIERILMIIAGEV
jgi:hypothetical protein